MNAGAFGGETWRHVVCVETINRGGEITRRDASEYTTSYRSVSGPADEWFIAATLQFDSKAASDQTIDNSIDIKQLLAKRAASQPVGSANCGSVFTNPPGDFAARLIEQCGLKGQRVGGAVVSEKHANFIINDNAATASDIESLIIYVQQQVEQQCDVRLHTEVRIVGEAAS
jgi:UDP-N-acetylmuramate dehydrogenase